MKLNLLMSVFVCCVHFVGIYAARRAHTAVDDAPASREQKPLLSTSTPTPTRIRTPRYTVSDSSHWKYRRFLICPAKIRDLCASSKADAWQRDEAKLRCCIPFTRDSLRKKYPRESEGRLLARASCYNGAVGCCTYMVGLTSLLSGATVSAPATAACCCATGLVCTAHGCATSVLAVVDGGGAIPLLVPGRRVAAPPHHVMD